MLPLQRAIQEKNVNNEPGWGQPDQVDNTAFKSYL
jgi:hypothetical protein